MKISTKGRYGIRSVLDIAIYSKGEHVPLYKIAERQNVSENYLEHVFSVLRKSGIVKSVKGAQGGYSLVEAPKNVTVGHVLRALEGDLSVVDEKTELEDAKNSIVEGCIKQVVWDEINKSINRVVDSITIEDLVIEYNKKNKDVDYIYYI